METQTSEAQETGSQALPAPQGVGMAVAVDWGLTAQITLMLIIALLTGKPMMGMPQSGNNWLFIVFSLLVACIPALFGEMVRSGRNWARWIQLVFSSLLSIAGIASLTGLYQNIIEGHYLALVTEFILIVISPLTVWRFSRPATAQWFKQVTPEQARKRHGGRWVWFIALIALIGGVLQSLAALQR